MFRKLNLSTIRRVKFSTVKEVQKVAVIGLGLMGHGVAQVAAQSGYEVVAVESNATALDIGQKRISSSLEKLISKSVKKEKITKEQGDLQFNETMARITPSTDINAAADCDLVVEAIAENMPLKLDFYRNLADKVKPEAIFASNTSSLQITQMAVASGRPKNFVGLHFFNPVQLMKLVEIIRTDQTNDESVAHVREFVKRINKVSVSCGDTPGFIVNRLLVPYMAQAMAMLDRGDASIADIDVSMQLGAGHPMGPLTLADYVGLDTSLSILEGWSVDYPNEPAFIVPEVLKEKVKAGHLGRKTGTGFYNWDGDKPLGVAE